MNTSPAYTKGIETERRLIEYLVENGYNINGSTREENVVYDIDCFHGQVPVSIKTQHTCLKTGNVAFELEVTTVNGNKEPGWFKSGKAVKYWIIIGRQLYQAGKQDVIDYVMKNGWRRKASLTAAKKASQLAIKHRHVDSLVGLLSLDELLKSKTITWVSELPFGGKE